MATTESIASSGNAVNRAFSKQSLAYDSDDNVNQVLQDMRQQVYRHVSVVMKDASEVLELNSGTGIDLTHWFRPTAILVRNVFYRKKRRAKSSEQIRNIINPVSLLAVMPDYYY